MVQKCSVIHTHLYIFENGAVNGQGMKVKE